MFKMCTVREGLADQVVDQSANSHFYMFKNPPRLPHPPPMEHVEDVERFSMCGLCSVQTHLQDQQHRRRLHYFALLV